MVVYAGPPNSPKYGEAILDELRRVIKDTSYESGQFELQGPAGSLVEVSDGHLIASGPAAFDYDLAAGGEHGTIEQLVLAIQTEHSSFTAKLIEDGDPNHDSTDIRMMPPVAISSAPFLFKTRRWSDSELSTAVDRAVGRHNLSVPIDPTLGYEGPHTAATIPKDHEYFIILLSQIELMKMLVQDAIKRRGTDLSAGDYSTIKASLEDEYNAALTRYLASRTGALPTEATEDMGSGDIIIGHSYREPLHSPAHGRWVRDMIAPEPPMVQLMATTLPGGRVQLRWEPSRYISFWKYELWRNTSPIVSNISDYVQPRGSIPAQGVKIREEFQQGVYQWVDGYTNGPLPTGTYYYRLYLFDRNGKTSEGTIIPALVP